MIVQGRGVAPERNRVEVQRERLGISRRQLFDKVREYDIQP